MRDDGGVPGLPDRLWRLQTDPTDRWRATVLAGTVGALLATVHWSGLLAGGALVGLAWPTLRRAVLAGLGFGIAVVALFAFELALGGSLVATLRMGVFGLVPVVVPVVAAPLGATVRGLVPDATAGD
ncbi:hypothetical protein GOC74_15925 [Halomicrobium mukohataei]|uniref:Uncharacterized protein n=1 Tax=Halomicrobium mukohataei TaxID=57705 RepID=A0A847UFZ6_9EURY|nr:hypothetical protein [Halomicrobium mukohataei]NLV11416.1 hypothetical protein [Halomicrobium mukohataei]